MSVDTSEAATGREPRVLLLGGTGRTGAQVLVQLLQRRVPVRAIVRSAARLPAEVAGDPLLTIIEGEIASMTHQELRPHLAGCDTVISCLGHWTTPQGLLGPPRDLVAHTLETVYRAAEAPQHDTPTRLIVISSVSVNRPARADTRRSWAERAFLCVVRGVLPPAKDNQRAADYLVTHLDPAAPGRALEWVCVRPDTLRPGEISAYAVTEGLVGSIFRPTETTRSNVAHFMCELATDDATWRRWKGQMPVIVNGAAG